MLQKLYKYFAKHAFHNAISHLALGLGIGIILSRPYFPLHPLRFGLLFIGLGLLGHLYPLFLKK